MRGSFPDARTKTLGFCSRTPAVMVLALRRLEGEVEGTEANTLISFGCLCHAFELVVEDLDKRPVMATRFKGTTSLASFYNNMHRSRHELDAARVLQHPVPQTIKSFSSTRWNGTSTMYTSVEENKDAILQVTLKAKNGAKI